MKLPLNKRPTVPAKCDPNGVPGYCRGPNLVAAPTGANLIAGGIVRHQLFSALTAAFFLLAGVLALTEHYVWLGGAAFIACGLVCGINLKAGLDSQPLLVRICLLIILSAALLTTYICYQTFSFLCLFPGMAAAIGSGQLIGMYARLLLSYFAKDAR